MLDLGRLPTREQKSALLSAAPPFTAANPPAGWSGLSPRLFAPPEYAYAYSGSYTYVTVFYRAAIPFTPSSGATWTILCYHGYAITATCGVMISRGAQGFTTSGGVSSISVPLNGGTYNVDVSSLMANVQKNDDIRLSLDIVAPSTGVSAVIYSLRMTP